MTQGRKFLTTIRNDSCKIFSVSNQKTETLSEFVKRIRKEKNLSTTDVEKNSRKAISSSYVTRIENEPNKKVSGDKLKALAVGLGISEDEVLKASGFFNENLDEIRVFFSGYEDLNEEDKDELKPMLVMLASDIRRRLAERRERRKNI
jgi:transcriptional regulator with XRE-family HTH domain